MTFQTPMSDERLAEIESLPYDSLSGDAIYNADAWALAANVRELAAEVKRLRKAAEQTDELLASIVLYINWRYVTTQLTTPQKELFAAALERDAIRVHGPDGDEPDPEMARLPSYAPRWWRDDQPAREESSTAEARDQTRTGQPSADDPSRPGAVAYLVLFDGFLEAFLEPEAALKRAELKGGAVAALPVEIIADYHTN